MEKVRTAFVLGAGLGTRLRPLTETCPKPLLPLGDRPIISYAFERLASVGVERFIVNTHHYAERYEEVFPEKNWKGIPITFRHEDVLLDTGGGIKNIEDLLQEDETFFVHNGDIVSDLPLTPLLEEHFQKNREATLALRSSGGPLHINFDTEQGLVRDIRDHFATPVFQSCLFTGIYLVNQTFLKRLPPDKPVSVIDIFLDMIREDKGLLGGVLLDEGSWSDAGTLEEYEKMKQFFTKNPHK